MKIIKGRDNLSATIYVPYNCSNNCLFCSSKKEYKNISEWEVMKALDKISQLDIKEIVITGGEPMNNILFLRYVSRILNNKDIYINTTFIRDNHEEFVKFVNETDCIKGINISRHSYNYSNDKILTKNILEDRYIKDIIKPVRINVVLTQDLTKTVFNKYITRWKDSNIQLNFRANYNDMTQDRLSSFIDNNLDILYNKDSEFINMTKCNVCSTLSFKYDSIYYSYHRGLPLTAITGDNNTLEINDIIVFPDGSIAYDWDRKNKYISEALSEFGYNSKPKFTNAITYVPDIGPRRNSCGGVIKNGC